MDIFEDYKTAKFFVEILNSRDSESLKKEFSDLVKKKFLEKVQTDEELDSYKITKKDLKVLLDEFASS